MSRCLVNFKIISARGPFSSWLSDTKFYTTAKIDGGDGRVKRTASIKAGIAPGPDCYVPGKTKSRVEWEEQISKLPFDIKPALRDRHYLVFTVRSELLQEDEDVGNVRVPLSAIIAAKVSKLQDYPILNPNGVKMGDLRIEFYPITPGLDNLADSEPDFGYVAAHQMPVRHGSGYYIINGPQGFYTVGEDELEVNEGSEGLGRGRGTHCNNYGVGGGRHGQQNYGAGVDSNYSGIGTGADGNNYGQGRGGRNGQQWHGAAGVEYSSGSSNYNGIGTGADGYNKYGQGRGGMYGQQCHGAAGVEYSSGSSNYNGIGTGVDGNNYGYQGAHTRPEQPRPNFNHFGGRPGMGSFGMDVAARLTSQTIFESGKRVYNYFCSNSDGGGFTAD